MTSAPPPPQPRLSLGITGHRATNPVFAANQDAVMARIGHLFSRLEALVAVAATGKDLLFLHQLG